jgi:outer membrane protein OmpA-like peptidoglycan-associated protein
MTYSDANFEKNSAVFTPGTAFQTYAKKVKEYLEQEENKGKKLLIVGHTCDLGSDSHNVNLGLRRAKAARKYFKDLGVAVDIGVKSDGETNPLSDYPNTSEENRSRNRRVNIQIK